MGGSVHPLASHTMSLGLRDVLAWAQSKLDRPWSAVAFAPHLNKETVEGLITRFSLLDPQARVMVVMATLSIRRNLRVELKPELERLIEIAKRDSDDWVRAMAFVAQDCDGKLNPGAVLQEFSGVLPPNPHPTPSCSHQASQPRRRTRPYVVSGVAMNAPPRMRTCRA